MDDQFGRDFVGQLPALRAFAMSLCGNHILTDDLVQEAVTKAWAAQKQFERGTNLNAWLHTILRNCYFDHLRSSKHFVEDGDGRYVATLSEKGGQENRIRYRDLRRALARLTPEQREAVVLGAAGFSYEEVAHITGCAVGTVKSRVSRARASLRRSIESGGDG